MPTNIRTSSPFNSLVPELNDPADIVKAFKDYHYGTTSYPTTDNAENSLTTGIVGLFNKKANLAGASFTGNISTTGNITVSGNLTVSGTTSLATATSIGDVTSTEISYLDGVTSSIQTQFTNLGSRVTTLESSSGGSAKKQVNPATVTNSTNFTLTKENILTEIIVWNPGVNVNGNVTITLPTASALTGTGIFDNTTNTNNNYVDWTIILPIVNITYKITFAGSTGHTIVGKPTAYFPMDSEVLGPASTVTSKILVATTASGEIAANLSRATTATHSLPNVANVSQAIRNSLSGSVRFRTRKIDNNNYISYRIS